LETTVTLRPAVMVKLRSALLCIRAQTQVSENKTKPSNPVFTVDVAL
jgi:hypothetical protein